MTRHAFKTSSSLALLILLSSCSGNNEDQDDPHTNHETADMDQMPDDPPDASDSGPTIDQDVPPDQDVVCEVTCDVLDFVVGQTATSTRYDAATQTVSVGLAQGAPAVSAAFLDASVSRTSDGVGEGADLPTIQGTVQGGVLEFDLSGIPANIDALDLTNLDLELDCGERRALIFTSSIAISSDSAASSFTCMNPFF